MVAETRLHRDMFLYPLFVMPGTKIEHPISAMPGISHFSADTLVREVESCIQLGLKRFLIFGVGEEKDPEGHSAHDFRNAVGNALRTLRAEFGNEILLVTDVCLCAYTDHGHCGLLHGQEILNDETLDVLTQMAVMHAEAGADIVAPSDMMDGRVLAIREGLDDSGTKEQPS